MPSEKAALFSKSFGLVFGALSVMGVPSQSLVAQEIDGAAVFESECLDCHDGSDERAMTREALGELVPEVIVRALTSGAMRYQGLRLSAAERRAVAVYLTGKDFTTDIQGAAVGFCEETPALGDPFAAPRWNGWSPKVDNSHYQPSDQAGLRAEDVPRLELKWAFGFADSTQAWSQPTVAAGRVFVGSQADAVFSLDAKTGCIHWVAGTESGVRSALSIGRVERPGGAVYAVYFGDMRGWAYALDAATGEELWKTRIEDHEFTRITGSPVLHEGTLYVPVSSWEESQGGNPDYQCCTFRGSLVAVDASTGEIRWKSYSIPEEPKKRSLSQNGVQLWGPSGGAIWSAPTVDAKRGVVYAATGNTYSEPAQATTDAVVAFDLETGAIRWVKQTVPNDVYVIGCRPGNPNCPEEVGPDFDFGTSPILATRPDGKEVLIAGQKSGVGYAMDPDDKGKVLWEYRAGQGGPLGGIEWGTAIDEKYAYFPVADLFRRNPGGLHAVDLMTGERVWYTPPPEPLCGRGRGCSPAQSAAITVIPGIVFSGSLDGGFRAYSTEDGKIVWEYDTNRDFETVNGVAAKGGSLVGPGPTVVDGMVYVNSGYGALGGRPGNVLLAFAASAAEPAKDGESTSESEGR